MSDSNGAIRVPQREIPVPAHLSDAARAQMAMGSMSNPPWPDQDDVAGWRQTIAQMDQIGLAGLGMMAQGFLGTASELDIDGTTVFEIVPDGIAADDRRVYLDVHGGALLWGGGESCREMGKITAGMVQARVWAVDYRMPPDHPFPAGVDDCLAAYRELLSTRTPADIVIGGASAGGNLAAAAVLKARDQGLPLPAGLVLNSPEIDLTEGGDSFHANLGVDSALTSSLMPANLLYAGGADLTDPLVSPLLADFAGGFPSTFLQTGTRDLFLSNAVRMHAKLRMAGIPADLHVMEAASHTMFFTGPEHEHMVAMIREFANKSWGNRDAN